MKEHYLHLKRKKSFSPYAPLKSTSSRSTYQTSSSSLNESPTPTHVAPPHKLRFVIPMKLEPQELPPQTLSPHDPYMSTVDNWPLGTSNSSPPPLHVSHPPSGLNIRHYLVSHIHHPDLNITTSNSIIC
ncbi:hypothetical protein Tco_0576887 [Tanacetum coccineum]